MHHQQQQPGTASDVCIWWCHFNDHILHHILSHFNVVDSLFVVVVAANVVVVTVAVAVVVTTCLT